MWAADGWLQQCLALLLLTHGIFLSFHFCDENSHQLGPLNSPLLVFPFPTEAKISVAILCSALLGLSNVSLLIYIFC